MQHDIVLKKLEFLPFDPRVMGGGGGGGGGGSGKIFATLLLHFVISINLICNMTMF